VSKELFIQELKNFHSHHANSLRSIKNAMDGLAKGEAACVKLHDCAIQKWIERRRDVLVRLYGSETVKKLEVRHEEWHEESQKICELVELMAKRKKGLMGKVFGKGKEKMREDEYDMALAYFSNLQELTEQIDSTFVRMSKRAKALTPDMFEGIE
jgi:hypothetical protein